MIIRSERPDDAAAIRAVITAAFADVVHSNHTEAAIVEALRAAGVLTISLVAVEGGQVVGHIAFSPVRIDGRELDWFGLGPLAVRPDRQLGGVGKALTLVGLDRLKAMNASGCVVLGEPDYYDRFGFKARPELRLTNVPPEYFMALPFSPGLPSGQVQYHPGFEARDAHRPGD